MMFPERGTNMKRYALLLLAVLMLLPCVASCGESNNEAISSSDTYNAAGTAEAVVTEAETDYLDNLPATDLNGRGFHIAGNNTATYTTLSEGAENGEPINDALYTRNVSIEEMYNVDLVEYCFETQADERAGIETAVLAGDSIYDIAFAGQTTVAAKLTVSGLLTSFDKIPYVDLTQEWWSRNNYQLRLAAKDYFPAGVFTPQLYRAMFILMYNKRIAENYNVTGLNEMVYNGTWTVDNMIAKMEGVTADLNGDAVMDQTDQYGLVYDEVAGFAFFIGSGGSMTSFDNDGVPYLTMDTDDTVSRVEFLAARVGNKQTCLRGEDYKKDTETIVFSEGRALFAGQTMSWAKFYRDMEDDFGVLPIPKYNEAQEHYSSYEQPWSGTGVVVPVTNADLETAGLIMETMAYLSSTDLRKAVYEITFKEKFARDTDSQKMLDMIVDSASFDLNVIFGWGGSQTILRDCVLGNKEGYASAYAAVAEKARTEIGNLADTLAALG